MEIAEIVTLIILFFIGAALGSFACCQAWRLRLKETKKSNPGKWSVCLSCGKRLSAKENIPIFSWLFQRGKCRHCGAKIGKAEILSELSLAAALVGLGAYFYPQVIAVFTSGQIFNIVMLILTMLLLIISIIIMWILMIYDAKWQKLPVKLLVVLNITAVIYAVVSIISVIVSSDSIGSIFTYLLSMAIAVALLGGMYFCLSFFSKEKLVGSGDWLVALPIALILGNWWLALVTLFISNLLGSIFGTILRVKKGTRQIPFGPFLIIGFTIVYAAQPWLLSLISNLRILV